MVARRNQMFTGDGILEAGFKLLGVLASGAYVSLLALVSSYLELGATGVAIFLKSGFRTQSNGGSGVVLTINDTLYEVTANGATVQLPAGVDGFMFHIKNDSLTSGTSITTTGGATVDGAASPYSLSNANDGVILQFRGTNWSILSSVARPTATPTWVKVNKTYLDFQTAALINSISIYTLPAGGVIHSVKMKQATAFAGTSITAVTGSVGISGDLNRELQPYDILQAVNDTTFAISGVTDSFDNAATTAILGTLRSVGANLSALTAGSVDFWLLVSVAT